MGLPKIPIVHEAPDDEGAEIALDGAIVGRVDAVAFSVDRDRWWKPRWNRFARGLS